MPETGREEYVEPEAEESEFARPVTAVYFLASAAESPFLPELVLDFPQAHDEASILQLALVRKFLAALLLPWAWVLVLPHSSADAALPLPLARKFLAALLSAGMWFLVLPDLAADVALRLALASSNLLGHFAELAWPSSPASPEPALWRVWESLKEALR